MPRPGVYEDLTGRRFQKLTAMAYEGRSLSRRSLWRVRCDCGREKILPAGLLVSGRAKSCGCQKGHHGLAGSRTYATWGAMIQRCTNPEMGNYQSYGGRGISVSPSWLKFEGFLADMGERPPGMTLDRINNDGNYEPGNCRWATRAEQSRNTRRNRTMIVGGERVLVTDVAEANGISAATARMRLHKGWPSSRAATEPTRFSGTSARASS